MKSIRFSNDEIRVIFNYDEEAQKLYEWGCSQLIDDYCSVAGNSFCYDIRSYDGVKKFYHIKSLLLKIVYDCSYLDKELYSSAFSTDKYDYVLDVGTCLGKIFRITPIKFDGSLGTLDFGVHQYSAVFRVSKLNGVDDVFFLSGRYHVGCFDDRELKLDGYCCGVLVEVGDVCF